MAESKPSGVMLTGPATLSRTPFEIRVRQDIDWDFSDVGENFAGSRLLSYFWAAVSAGSPPVEGFFIRALRPALKEIMGDDQLKEHVNCMLAQEAHHAAAHAIFNQRLIELGYDIPAAEEKFKAALKKMNKGLDPIDMMGVVSAGEHGLYSFAKVYLRSERIMNSLNAQARRFFCYHFLEEAEHGAVSHDQYRYFKKNDYAHRLKTAWRARFAFSMVFQAMGAMMRSAGYKSSLRERIEFLQFLLIRPGMLTSLGLRFAEYMAPWYKLSFTHENPDEMKKWDRNFYSDQPGSGPEAQEKAA